MRIQSLDDYLAGPAGADVKERSRILKICAGKPSAKKEVAERNEGASGNRPCPCGSGKKYKRCCGKG